jgi:hypothetical protein
VASLAAGVTAGLVADVDAAVADVDAAVAAGMEAGVVADVEDDVAAGLAQAAVPVPDNSRGKHAHKMIDSLALGFTFSSAMARLMQRGKNIHWRAGDRYGVAYLQS